MAGQIIKRGNRKYLVRVSLGRDAQGKRKTFSKTINGTKKEAEAFKNKILHKLDTGTFVQPTKEYFSNFIINWRDNVAIQRVSSKTLRGYEQSIRLYLIPYLGNTKLNNITPEQIQSMYQNMMTEKGLSSATIRNTHAVLNSSLKQAVKWGKLYRNPAELVDLPKKNSKEMKVLSKEEVDKFLEAVIYNKMKALFTLLITTGMRPGEAFALKWSDVDFENNRITVNKSLSRPGGKWKLVEPKTPRGRRSLPVPNTVMGDLKEHKRNQASEKLSAKKNIYADQDFVFATKTGEPYSDRNIISKYFKPLLKSAELPNIRLYDLRHTCATMLLLAGENPKVVSERLGHADVALTLNTYSHVLPSMQENASKRLEDMLFGSQAKTKK